MRCISLIVLLATSIHGFSSDTKPVTPSQACTPLEIRFPQSCSNLSADEVTPSSISYDPECLKLKQTSSTDADTVHVHLFTSHAVAQDFDIPPTPLTTELKQHSTMFSVSDSLSPQVWSWKLGPLPAGFYHMIVTYIRPEVLLASASVEPTAATDVTEAYSANVTLTQVESFFKVSSSPEVRTHNDALSTKIAKEKRRKDDVKQRRQRHLQAFHDFTALKQKASIVTDTPKLKQLQNSDDIWDTTGILHPRFIELIDKLTDPQTQFDPSFQLGQYVAKEEPPLVFSFPLLDPNFVEEIVKEVLSYEQLPVDGPRPNTMNKYGMTMGSLGLDPFVDTLVGRYLSKLAGVLYPLWGGKWLNHQHSFVVRYKVGEDVDLDRHMDQCEITVNVGLGLKYKGGEVFYEGIRDAGDDTRQLVDFSSLPVGYAVMHVGQQWHGAQQLLSGERINMIVWMRSEKYHQSVFERWIDACQT